MAMVITDIMVGRITIITAHTIKDVIRVVEYLEITFTSTTEEVV